MVESVDFELDAGPPDAATPAVVDLGGAPPALEVASAVAAARPNWLRQRLVDFALLMRLDRPIGIWLLLWPTLWALWSAAGGHPQ